MLRGLLSTLQLVFLPQPMPVADDSLAIVVCSKPLHVTGHGTYGKLVDVHHVQCLLRTAALFKVLAHNFLHPIWARLIHSFTKLGSPSLHSRKIGTNLFIRGGWYEAVALESWVRETTLQKGDFMQADGSDKWFLVKNERPNQL